MKKIFCLMLTLIMAFGGFGNVLAASPDIKLSKTEQMENDIKNEINIARKEIYRQLEQQDALILMKVYEDIIYPQIERQIRAEYGEEVNTLNGTSMLMATSSSSYYAPNGGLVTYLSPVSGYQPTEVAITCFDRDDSYSYLLKVSSSFTLKDALLTVLGYVPNKIGIISSSILNIQGFKDREAIKQVDNAGGCAQIINTYSREWGTEASLLTGWSDRYYINVPSSATNVTITRF